MERRDDLARVHVSGITFDFEYGELWRGIHRRNPLSFKKPYSWIVYKDRDVYMAEDWRGRIRFEDDDASEVIQSALNSLTPNRTWKERVVLVGEFILTRSIDLPDYVILDLRMAKLVMGSGVNEEIITAWNKDYIEIIGGVLLGNGEDLDEQFGIRLGACRHVLIRDVEITNCRKPAIAIGGVDEAGNFVRNAVDIRIVRVYIHDQVNMSGADGIYAIMQDSIIDSPRIVNVAGDSCIAISGNPKLNENYISKNVVIANLYAYNTGALYLANNGENIEIIAPRIVNAVDRAIRTDYTTLGTAGVSGVRIIGGKIISPGDDGVEIRYASGWKIYGLKIINAGGYGIDAFGDYHEFYMIEAEGCSRGICIDWGSHTKVIGGYFKNNEYGIAVLGNASDVRILYPYFEGNTTHFYDAGTNTIIKCKDGYVTENSGVATFSGDGSTTEFKIEHGLAKAPSKYVVSPLTPDADAPRTITVDDTYIIITFSTAPPSGTDNLKFGWWAEV